MMIQSASRMFAGLFWLVHESSLRPHHKERSSNGSSFLGSVLNFALKSTGWATASIVCFFALYFVAASPPLHLFYDVASPAGPASVYLPGGGFSGFWFHLGYLHSVENIHEFDYYCFSAGCLSILSVFMNRTLEEASDAAFSAQEAWKSGNKTRFELVEHFFDELVPQNLDDDEASKEFLPRIKILVTTVSEGFRVVEASNRQELKDSIVKTTWVPYLTGWGIMADENEVYLDGGFSRLLHPECETELHLPLIWETLVHTFSPGLTRNQVRDLWNVGYGYDYPLSATRRTSGESVSSHYRGAPTQQHVRDI